MSCHDIGRGLNSVAMVVIDLYDHGEITIDAARKLLHQCCKGVHWCDGNEYEAVACCRENRCGYCLKKLETGTPIFNLYDVIGYMYTWEERQDKARIVEDYVDEKTGYTFLCEHCLVKLLTEACGDKAKVLNAIKEMKEKEEKRYWSVNEDNESDWYCEKYYAEKEKK